MLIKIHLTCGHPYGEVDRNVMSRGKFQTIRLRPSRDLLATYIYKFKYTYLCDDDLISVITKINI